MVTDEEQLKKIERIHDALAAKFTKSLFKAVRKLSVKNGMQLLPGVYSMDVQWDIIIATGLPTDPATIGKTYRSRLHVEIDPFKKEKTKAIKQADARPVVPPNQQSHAE